MTATNTYKKATAASVGTSPVTLYTVPGGTQSIVKQISLANVTNAGVQVTVTLYDATGVRTINLGYQISIPVGSTFELFERGERVLEAGDYIQVVSTVASSIDVYMPIVEGIN